ncbi:OsmC family protein [Cellulomonas sp. APG4]|uniref:OsmC family protein n=1 Tax=Cellulomonas sp. APG4 TaxID=1538656 RepID=UPI001379DA74|nr:OsmC family protein [Cellulomonas sp. APG4]NCT91767.1 OsmC family protein [Cellulomonas sp. APG4]
MSDDVRRSVSIERLEQEVYLARNARGGELRFGSGEGADFTPVELLLAAIAGCTAVGVDVVTSRRAEPERFTATVEADKVRDATGSILRDIVLTLEVRFPEGPDGDAARAALPRALEVTHDHSCTVSRTIEASTPVRTRLA